MLKINMRSILFAVSFVIIFIIAGIFTHYHGWPASPTENPTFESGLKPSSRIRPTNDVYLAIDGRSVTVNSGLSFTLPLMWQVSSTSVVAGMWRTVTLSDDAGEHTI